MNKIKIPKKKKGEFREIVIPTVEEKISFSNQLPDLNKKASQLCLPEVHGFMLGKSPVTNAKAHIGYRYTVSFDLKDFFDTVTINHVKGKISESQIQACMPEGRAYQGLPTSPVIANIAASDLDKGIIKKFPNIVYTRYADDLSFSFNEYSNYTELLKWLPEIVGRCGFKLNKNKTRLQDARFGNRVITGISVGDKLSVTRNQRRKLRAAKHQGNLHEVKGLEEWARLKEPQKKNSYTQKELNRLCKVWKIKRIQLKLIPKKEEIIDGDFIITGDVPYMLGMSNFTTNWSSCVCHPNGKYHKSVLFWPYLEGTRIAALLSDETITVEGFTRRKMRARTLVHTLSNGITIFDRVYGEDPKAVDLLIKHLNNKGIFFIYNPIYNSTEQLKGLYVKGQVSEKLLSRPPYCDNLSWKKDIPLKVNLFAFIR